MTHVDFQIPRALLAAGVLPSPPGVVMEVLRLVADDDSTVAQIAAVIETDPVLAARLLGAVNSSLYTLVREIHSINDAAVLLGLRSVRSLALGVSVSGSLPEGSGCAGFDAGLYWRHSLLTAVVAKGLAAKVNRRLAEDAFTVGLIANIGRLVVANAIPDEYAKVLVDNPWPNSEEEEAVLGYSTAQVSAGLLNRWGLPDSLCFAVRHVDHPERLPDDSDDVTRRSTALVSAADTAVDHLLVAEDDEAVRAIAGEIATLAGVDDATAHEVLTDAAEQISSVAPLISASLPSTLSPADFISQAEELLAKAGA